MEIDQKNTYGIIYMYRNTINDKVYIGQTIQPLYRRRNDHIQDAKKHRNNMYFHHAIRKYGFNAFEEQILYKASNQDDLNTMEQFFIEKFNSNNKTNGYNSMNGGSHGKHSEETKTKISQASKKLWQNPDYQILKSETGKANIKFAVTPEGRKKGGMARRGRKVNDAQIIGLLAGKEACKKPVIRIDPITGTETIYASSKEASIRNNTTPQKIWSAINMVKSNKHRGFVWRYAGGC